ncbi:MAG: SLC13 family permease [Nitrososphaerales archaeon]
MLRASLDDIRYILAVVIFLGTYAAIAFRNVRGSGLPIWASMLVGAVAMVFSGVIEVSEAYRAINLEVIVFLFSMFTFVTAMDVSGMLEDLAAKLFLKAKKPEDIVYLTFFVFGLASAVLMNDTLALMGTPIMISLAKKMRISSKPLLITLAFSVTIGSALTPMGNPQNLLIALVSGLSAPVLTFVLYLALPTLANLFLTSLVIRWVYRREFRLARKSFTQLIDLEVTLKETRVSDPLLAKQTAATLTLTVVGIVLINIFESMGAKIPLGISEVSLFGATMLLLLSSRRREILKRLDWSVLVLFAGLFVLMQGVMKAGIIAQLSAYLPQLNRDNLSYSLIAILASSILLSQLVSNVPMVALYLPMMKAAGYGGSDALAWVALAGGSTLAGNLTLIGAASNLIIVEEAESRGHTLGFFEFLKIGLPVSALNMVVLYLSLVLFM